jgi:ElaB/YqjD/DUF883 family membrane-anchored ribosome-binding protein
VKAKNMLSTLTKAAAKATEASAHNDLMSQGREAAHKVERAAGQFYDQATDYADDATRKVRSFADRTCSDFNTAKGRATAEVRANPLPAALTLLGVGLVLGFLLRASQRA